MSNKDNKKVCIITTVHTPFDIRIFHKEAKTLLASGYEITLIATYPNNQEEFVDGIKICPLPNPKSRFERIFINTYRALKLAIKEKADIYQYPDPELHFVAFLLKILTGKIVIHDIHEHYSKDIIAKQWIPKHYRKLYLFFFNIYERLFVPYLDALIYVVPSIADRYKYFKKEKVEVRNYPVIKMFESLSDEDIEQNRDYQRIIFNGLMSPERGIREIIEAISIVASKFPNVNLDLIDHFSTIGSSKEESFKEEIEKLIKKYNLEKNITIHKLCKQQEMPVLLSKAATGLVLYLPVSENNVIGLPNKIFEYMICKVAVLCSNFPLYEEVIQESQCGYSVDPTSPALIADKIMLLLSDKDKLKEMGMAGYRKIYEKFNWENESTKFLNLYDSLSKGKVK